MRHVLNFIGGFTIGHLAIKAYPDNLIVAFTLMIIAPMCISIAALMEADERNKEKV